MITINTKYDYEAHQKNSPGVNFDPKKNNNDRSLTNQADMDSADINKIMSRFEKTGLLGDGLTARQPIYGDFTEVKDYHQMLIAVKNVERAFNTLTANVRNRFDNDPQKLINFLEDPKNNAEAVELGLMDKSVLFSALADDGVTRITPEERKNRDDQKIAEAAAKAAASQPVPAAK